MQGMTLVFKACRLIVRFAAVYYTTHRSEYTNQQQTVLDNLITAAEALINVIQESVV